MANIIGIRSQAYSVIFERIRTAGEAVMVGEIYEMCKHNPVITGQQQIADAVCQYHKKGLLKRYRYGRKFKYFVPSVDNATQVTEQPVPSQVNVVASVSKDVSSKPEIIVNEDSIVINHAKCKITIEF